LAGSLLTVGHGTLGAEAFADLARSAGVGRVVDIRRFPGSRRHPHFARAAMEEWLPEAGVAYRWEQRLGGRRHGRADSPNGGLQNAAFRAYADHMASAEFGAALEAVLVEADAGPTAVMCAETLWWRCHRRLVADAATLVHGRAVEHLFPDGTRRPHAVTDGATVVEGIVVYPPEQPQLL
jgi:uncharacterized protein (DUF488 family)